mmetsp:Transcript_20009/g.49786  ORF Transcript_20009/g.49786 Transcript_20009/m.49786 type:complete len:204 (+) Transcript_20009:1067-1678(+)
MGGVDIQNLNALGKIRQVCDHQRLAGFDLLNPPPSRIILRYQSRSTRGRWSSPKSRRKTQNAVVVPVRPVTNRYPNQPRRAGKWKWRGASQEGFPFAIPNPDTSPSRCGKGCGRISFAVVQCQYAVNTWKGVENSDSAGRLVDEILYLLAVLPHVDVTIVHAAHQRPVLAQHGQVVDIGALDLQSQRQDDPAQHLWRGGEGGF